MQPTNAPENDDEIENEDSKPLYDAEQMKGAGVKISINYFGKISIDRGLVEPSAKRGSDGEAVEPEAKTKPEYSTRLMDELAHQHTAALRLALSQDQDAALAALTHALVSKTLYGGYADSALNIQVASVATDRPELVPNPEECTAQGQLQKQQAGWRKKMPKDEQKLFAWLMKQERAVVLDLLTFSTALTLQASIPHSSMEPDRRDAAVTLGQNLTPPFDMAEHWEPTAAGFVGRLSKAQMAKALQEVGDAAGADEVAKMKKDAAAARTAHALKGKGWLPGPLMSSGIGGRGA